MEQPNEKLPLPRLLHRRSRDSPRRVARACDICRQRKSKCDGASPCAQCRALQTECIYSHNKRTKDKMVLRSAHEMVKRYEELLRDLYSRSQKQDQRKIAAALKNSPGENVEMEDLSPSSSSSSVQSLEAIDVVEEDLNNSPESQATGYFGKNSEISWLRRLEDAEITKNTQCSHAGPSNPTNTSAKSSVSSVSYFPDDLQPSLHTDVVTNPWEIPPKQEAQSLLHSYLASVHGSFPVIRKSLFLSQFEKLYSYSVPQPGNKWLAILNLIFAIGSKHWQWFSLDQSDEDPDVFFNRAKSLCLDESLIYDHDDLQQVQAETLMAFYFLSSGQINRGWKIIGIAARSGIALGLNLRNTSDIDPASREARCSLWWSIFYLEHIYSAITSRPSCLADNSSSVYPPVPVEETKYDLPPVKQLLQDMNFRNNHFHWTLDRDHPSLMRQNLLESVDFSQALYFFYLVDLAKITHAVTNRVYNRDVLIYGWEKIAARMEKYSAKLDTWLSNLRPPLRFTNEHGEISSRLDNNCQASLAFHYYSSRIVLSRPCLTRPDVTAETGVVYPRSPFGNEYSVICLRSALDMISILPECPEPAWVTNITPWWCLLHFVMQSTSILLIHLSVGPVDVKAKVGEETSGEGAGASGTAESPEIVMEAAKKALSWLEVLGKYDISWHRAFNVCSRILGRISQVQGFKAGEESLQYQPERSSSQQERMSGMDTQGLDAHEWFSLYIDSDML